MTLNEAIEHCEEVANEMTSQGECEECAKDHRQLAEWLKELKKLREQQTCEDCISRQAVLDQINLWSKDELLKFTNPFYYLHKRINSLPSTAPQSKVGYWTNIPSVFGNYECSECGCLEIEKSNYCPDCGAKMQEVKENG